MKEDSSYAGFIYDHLKEFTQYTGWEYEFVVEDMSTLMEMLKNQEIDLLGGMYKREGFEQYYAYPNYNSGFLYSTLIIASDDQSISESDTCSLDQKTIGYYDQSISRINSIESFLAANGVTYNLKRYDDYNEYVSALKNKEVDVLISNDTLQIENTRVIYRFVSEPHFFATYKGNTKLLGQLNMALQQISEIDPKFNYRLRLKYLDDIDNYNFNLSEAEKVYVELSKPLVVAAASNWAPYQYSDDKGQLHGISIDLLRKIAERTGLKFEFIQTNSHLEAVELVESGQADLTAGVPSSKERSRYANIKYTQPYLSFSKILIMNKQSNQISDDSVFASTPINDYLREPNTKNVLYYETLQECIEAINSGQADYTLVDNYSIEHLMAYNNYRDIVNSTFEDAYKDIYIGLNKNLDYKLQTIINKAIRSISVQEKATIVLNSYLEIENEITLESFLDSNPHTVQYIILAVIVIIGLVLALFLRFRIRLNRKMYYLANTDPLTGSRNFTRFKEDAAELLKGNKPYVVAYSDFQAFKYINDRHGYAEGDKVLKKVAEVLKDYLRPNEIFCRISADTFVVLLERQSREELLERYLKHSEDITQIKVGDDSNYQLKLWTGFFYEDDPQKRYTLFEMMDRAILAQKHVKASKEMNYAFYDDNLRSQMLKEQSIESKMSAALQNGEFMVYLQPKYDLQSMKPSGAEALVRWITSDGVVPPSDFIPLFERNCFIIELDKYIFEQCCKILRYWLDHNMPVVSIAVNVSRVQLSSDQFVATYIGIKNKYNIPDGYLELEFTESIVFDDTARLVRMVNELKAAGFTCTIDDFGRGYSSLTVLKDIPADILKMDAQFFDKGHDKHKDTIMIESTLAMGKALHMKVVAEGIETWDQVEYLKGIGCDMVQGYVFARPMPLDQFELFLVDELPRSSS